MPPKAVPNATASQDVKILIELIRTATEFKADTSQMAAVCGLTSAKNVPRKINSVIAPFGFELKSGKIFYKDGNDNDKSTDENARVSKTLKTPKSPNTPKAKSAKKHKVVEQREDDEVAAKDDCMEAEGVKVHGELVNGQAFKEAAVNNGEV